VTYGQNVRADEAWPAVLGRFTGHDVRNAGVCGDTTRLGLERFPKHVQLHRPDVVLIQFGHNDVNCWDTDNGLPRVSAEAYRANLREMISRSEAVGAAAVLMEPHQVPRKDESYNERLRRYWLGLPGIASPMVTVLDDGYGVHPDREMHGRIAAGVARALRSL
jgi:lysophospholipase L1-like esterase